MIALKKILVATDFSEPSEAALAYGRELARSFGASLTVLHVVDNILTRAYGIDDGVVLTDPELQREIEASAREQVERAAQRRRSRAARGDRRRAHVERAGVRDRRLRARRRRSI